MIEPGLYRHYKSTDAAPKLYRVLFVAPWWSVHRETLLPDQPLHVVHNEYSNGLLTSVTSTAFMTALWSGNSSTVRLDERVVIYVALYGEGRVAARTEKEFAEHVAPHERRFERIAD